MRDVSRVEYDAALKRVRASFNHGAINSPACPTCEAATLAALGLDEPPTEDDGGHRMSGYTPGRYTLADTDNAGMRDMPSLTSQVKYMRTGYRYGDGEPGLILVVVADDERDAAVALVRAALEAGGKPTEAKPFDVRDHPMAFPSHVDEPPTEVPLAVERAHIIERLHKIENGEYSVIEMAHDLERLARHPVWEASNKAAADVEAAYDRGRAEAVVPPAEPPKACPTSDEPLGTCAIHGNYWTDDCLRCGSGIDGGTQR